MQDSSFKAIGHRIGHPELDSGFEKCCKIVRQFFELGQIAPNWVKI